jgi:hypothetical protein
VSSGPGVVVVIVVVGVVGMREKEEFDGWMDGGGAAEESVCFWVTISIAGMLKRLSGTQPQPDSAIHLMSSQLYRVHEVHYGVRNM